MAEFSKRQQDAAYRAAEHAIEKARAEAATELDLSGHRLDADGSIPRYVETGFAALTRLPPQIAALTGLQTLLLINSHISDLRPLTTLNTLQHLFLDGTEVSDLSPVAALTGLKLLSLTSSQVSDFAPLAPLTGLQILSLAETQVSDLSFLAALTGLQDLSLERTKVSDLTPLATLNNLLRLSLHQTRVNDLNPLAGLDGLKVLSLDRTQVSEIAILATLTGLEHLRLDGTQVSDLGPLAALTGLHTLRLDQTQVSDLAPLAALTGLQDLSLDETQVSDLAPLAALTGLQTLRLDETQVSDLAPLVALRELRVLTLSSSSVRDLRPLLALSKLGTNLRPGLAFADTPATYADPTLHDLSQIEDPNERAEKTLAYLNTLPPWPEPLTWQPPPSIPDTPPPLPDPDPVPRVDIAPEGLDLASSPIDPLDLSDPIKARLYARLPDAAAALLRHGNRYPEVAGPARELVALTSVAFDSADLLDIHLQLAALTDVRTADADRPLLERLDPDCRTALDAVLRIGPGVTLGHPDVDALEVRLAEYARLRQPATVAEGERRVTGALAEREELATERLRKVAGQVSKAGNEGRLPEYRRGFSRNVIIALGVVASGLSDAALGYVYGEIAIAAAQFLVLHRDAIMATAPAWGQTGYAWLEYILVRADLILRDAKSGHLNKQ